MDAQQSDEAYDLAMKEIEEKQITDEAEMEAIECRYCREMVTKFGKDGERVYRKFKEMLITRKVPEDWSYDKEIPL